MRAGSSDSAEDRRRDAGRTAAAAAPEAWKIRRPDWKRFKPHRRRSDARGAAGELPAMEPQEARGKSPEAKPPQPRA